jgi:MoxR-like ATPase
MLTSSSSPDLENNQFVAPESVDPSANGSELNPRAQATLLAHALMATLDGVLLGLTDTTRFVVAAVLARGHILLEDRPGVGKTLLAKTLATAIGGTSSRVQGSVDVLPGDITGSLVLDPSRAGSEKGPFRFVPGPVFNNVLILDELNRISPRAQAALLEAMEERSVTIEGQPHELPQPFLVIATQNQTNSAGTYPLLQGQIDRFTLGLTMGLPSEAAERSLLLGTGGTMRLASLRAITTPTHVLAAQEATDRVHLAPELAGYVVSLVRATRAELGEALGASPRASLMIAAVARALAVLDDRDYVAPDDVQHALWPVLGMRLHADLPEDAARARITGYLRAVPVPLPTS